MDDFMKNSSLYNRFLKEREEILKHKWVLSERFGRDVGYNHTILHWIRNHRKDWLESQEKKN